MNCFSAAYYIERSAGVCFYEIRRKIEECCKYHVLFTVYLQNKIENNNYYYLQIENHML